VLLRAWFRQLFAQHIWKYLESFGGFPCLTPLGLRMPAAPAPGTACVCSSGTEPHNQAFHVRNQFSIWIIWHETRIWGAFTHTVAVCAWLRLKLGPLQWAFRKSGHTRLVKAFCAGHAAELRCVWRLFAYDTYVTVCQTYSWPASCWSMLFSGLLCGPGQGMNMLQSAQKAANRMGERLINAGWI
jgi:hypothetical protein